MSKFQIATKPGHRASEHIYVIMSLIFMYEQKGKGLIVTSVDLSKYFDKENAIDCCYELYKSNIKGKVYRLIYLLNKNIRIRVKTPVGVTETEDTGSGMAQGTVMASIVSSASLDNGTKEYFNDEEKIEDDPGKETEKKENKKEDDEVKYDEVVIKPLLFQDDIFSTANSRNKAEEANIKLEKMIESKQLDFNLSKCNFIIAGGKKGRERLQKEVNKEPLTLCNTVLKQTAAQRYLGCMVSATATASVSATVDQRIGLANHAIYEIRAVLEDSLSTTVGGIALRFSIWNASVIPMLLWEAETWYPLPKKTLKKLDSLMTKQLRVTMGIGKHGCPLPSLYWFS